jgi:hypothetical protein
VEHADFGIGTTIMFQALCGGLMTKTQDVCDLAGLSLMLSARVGDLECIRNGGTQVQRREVMTGIASTKETKRNGLNKTKLFKR